MKVNARHYTKNYLMGIREEALRELTGMGVLVAPKNKNIETQVMPWLFSKICDFLQEDEAATGGSKSVVSEGLDHASHSHKATIQAKYDAIEKARLDKIEAEKQRVIRKQNRRVAREIRAKDLELEKFKDKVQQNCIFKGE